VVTETLMPRVIRSKTASYRRARVTIARSRGSNETDSEGVPVLTESDVALSLQAAQRSVDRIVRDHVRPAVDRQGVGGERREFAVRPDPLGLPEILYGDE
jgi:hypothetical protein